jgi:hypothetical protein
MLNPLKDMGRGNPYGVDPHPGMLGDDGLVLSRNWRVKGARVHQGFKDWLFDESYLTVWLNKRFGAFRDTESLIQLQEFFNNWIDAKIKQVS